MQYFPGVKEKLSHREGKGALKKRAQPEETGKSDYRAKKLIKCKKKFHVEKTSFRSFQEKKKRKKGGWRGDRQYKLRGENHIDALGEKPRALLG